MRMKKRGSSSTIEAVMTIIIAICVLLAMTLIVYIITY